MYDQGQHPAMLNNNIIGGQGESVVDILENIPSDNERSQAATDGGGRRYRFRRPAEFELFRPRRARSEDRYGGHGGNNDAASIDSSSVNQDGVQSAGEEPEEQRRITAYDVQKKESDIYNISGSEDDEKIDPMSNDYIGIIANYFSVGLMIGGSTSLLYPVLIVQAGATASLMTASYAVVMVFWSYKIVFGFLSDCFPIFGYKRKGYITIGVSC